MRIAVFGAGAVGGYFGARLARAGEDVVFIARGAHLEAIRQRGLSVESPLGDFHIYPAQATDSPEEVGPVDVVLVGVKAWQVPEVAPKMGPLLGPETFIVPLENGVEAPDQLAAVWGKERVLGGLCRIISTVPEPGRVRHGGMEPYVAFGELDNRPSERARQLQAAFERAGVRAEIPADIHVALWEKFLFITPFAGMGAVTRAPVGILRSVPQLRRMLEEAIAEAFAVGRARGVRLPDDAPARTMALIDGMPPQGTTSMQRDIIAGKPSELDYLVGAVVRLGEAAGLETPIHRFLYYALWPQERRARGELAF
ncbi:MAG: 2-dehydropantoate 2-reductase [Anaerolineae bacterium]|nr:2-dehydropantoate 2-reductase [Anaerolineae bacterium]MCX8067258.1 2-dehydropantoate 2-reductase [Anaerolineae bacterium]MDW7992277.1 2-dehydropantoate 2-reductase [Anaerolineae bacterium]